MKKLTTILTLCTLTTAAVGTSFAADRITPRTASIHQLTSVTPVEIKIESAPDQAIFPLALAVAGGVVMAAAIVWYVDFEYHGDCASAVGPKALGASDAVFDVTTAR